MLKEGDKAPEFEIKDQDGNTVRLSEFAGKKVVLYFYPKDNTPGCTKQACNLRDNYEELTAKGYIVLGVSPDSAKKHKNFIDKFELPFRLLVDNELILHNLYGTWGEKQMYGRKYMGTLRTTFIIDESGIIESIISKVKTSAHVEQFIK